jgi:hypothetical protein
MHKSALQFIMRARAYNPLKTQCDSHYRMMAGG